MVAPHLTLVSRMMFYYTPNLEMVSMPNLIRIEDREDDGSDDANGAFQSSALTELYLPRLKHVGGYAFFCCDIKTVFLPLCEEIAESGFC